MELYDVGLMDLLFWLASFAIPVKNEVIPVKNVKRIKNEKNIFKTRRAS